MAEDAILVKGWPQLAAGTAQLTKNIEADTQHRYAGIAGQVASQASGAMPRVSGRLAGSVTTRPGPPAAAVMGGGVPYAGWIEFGGGHGRPYIGSGRYFWPAVEAARPIVAQAAQTAATTQAKGMSWPTPT